MSKTQKRVLVWIAIAVLASIAAGASTAAFAASDDKIWIPLTFGPPIENPKHDPTGVWTDREISEMSVFPVEHRTTRMQAARHTNDRGTFIVSKFYNNAAGFRDEPIRVLFTPKGKTAGQIVTPADYSACQSAEHYYIRHDGSALRACDQVIELATPEVE